ncbi:hypothetical protein ANN_00232 [Periplaneta americana]|uniref:Uncharacterized protein n=1 Tax=Periplaneta americana TaxID=6978 RepID=A0ABQ8TQ72_PERAM|nr:hypothetical protein ANN_00232 [Periplaneta americana]
MSPGSSTESYPAFARVWLRENPGKSLNQVTCPNRDSNPGHLVSQPDALTVTPRVWTPPYRKQDIQMRGYISVAGVPEFCPAGVLLHASKSTDMRLSHLSTLKCHRPGPGSNPQPWAEKASAIPTRQPGRPEFGSRTAAAEVFPYFRPDCFLTESKNLSKASSAGIGFQSRKGSKGLCSSDIVPESESSLSVLDSSCRLDWGGLSSVLCGGVVSVPRPPAVEGPPSLPLRFLRRKVKRDPRARTVGPWSFSVPLRIPWGEAGVVAGGDISVAGVPEFCPAGVLLHASKCTDMSLSHLSTLKCHRPGPGSNPQPWAEKASAIPTRQPGRLYKMLCFLFNDARNCRGYISVAGVPEFCPAGVLLHASKSTDMRLSHLSTLKCHRPGPGSNPQPWAEKASAIPTRQPGRPEFGSRTAAAEVFPYFPDCFLTESKNLSKASSAGIGFQSRKGSKGLCSSDILPESESSLSVLDSSCRLDWGGLSSVLCGGVVSVPRPPAVEGPAIASP